MVDFPPLSPTALQDFVTCPRRFQLRYLDRLLWPGHIAEPVEEWERRVQLGVDFHRLAQQHLLGLDETLLSRRAASGDPQLAQWWAAYLAHRPPVLAEAHLFPEWPLAITVRDRHLTARLDVLALTAAGTAWIIDWKTTLTKPRRVNLAERLKSRLYPWLLAEAQAIEPAAIRLLYWYPHHPVQPELFLYNADLHHQAAHFLDELLADIERCRQAGQFPLTPQLAFCAYCNFRSYCERGGSAGSLSSLPDELAG